MSADQVVHHTPDAAAAVRSLARLLAPGGVLAFYVYKRKAPLREYADDYLRERTTKMSVEECMEFSAAMSELGPQAVGPRTRRSRSSATSRCWASRPASTTSSGSIYWHFLKCFWNDDFSPNLNDLVNFDWYHPPYASRHTEDEVRGWCDDARPRGRAPRRRRRRDQRAGERCADFEPHAAQPVAEPDARVHAELAAHSVRRGDQIARRRGRRWRTTGSTPIASPSAATSSDDRDDVGSCHVEDA